MIVIKCDPMARYGSQKPEEIHPVSEMYYPAETSATLAAVGKLLWARLFTMVQTQEELAAWEADVPEYGCSCKNFYFSWKSKNPPTFPLLPRWKYDLKSAVNEKLKHPNITFEEACGIWGWQETQ
jgi:hypothetical protein